MQWFREEWHVCQQDQSVRQNWQQLSKIPELISKTCSQVKVILVWRHCMCDWVGNLRKIYAISFEIHVVWCWFLNIEFSIDSIVYFVIKYIYTLCSDLIGWLVSWLPGWLTDCLVVLHLTQHKIWDVLGMRTAFNFLHGHKGVCKGVLILFCLPPLSAVPLCVAITYCFCKRPERLPWRKNMNYS